MELNCSINFHLEFSKMSDFVRTDSVDQDQTAQTVQSDVGFILSVNLWDIYFVKYITLKWQYSGFNNMFNFFSASYGLNVIIKAQDAIVNFLTLDKQNFYTPTHKNLFQAILKFRVAHLMKTDSKRLKNKMYEKRRKCWLLFLHCFQRCFFLTFVKTWDCVVNAYYTRCEIRV